MANQQAPKAVPYNVANQAAIDRVESILHAMKQPMNQNSETQKKLRIDLKAVLQEILVLTQKMLLLNHQGKPNGVKADAVGWTTASTDYDNVEILKSLPAGKLVNTILREIIKEQEQVALDKDITVSETQILLAQNDALDASKKEIKLESINHEGKEATRLVIDKETGDTTIFEKDIETGEFKKVGILKRFWINVKDFCKNIWNWIVNKFKQAKNWIKGLFKSPEDSDVIYKEAA